MLNMLNNLVYKVGNKKIKISEVEYLTEKEKENFLTQNQWMLNKLISGEMKYKDLNHEEKTLFILCTIYKDSEILYINKRNIYIAFEYDDYETLVKFDKEAFVEIVLERLDD